MHWHARCRPTWIPQKDTDKTVRQYRHTRQIGNNLKVIRDLFVIKILTVQLFSCYFDIYIHHYIRNTSEIHKIESYFWLLVEYVWESCARLRRVRHSYDEIKLKAISLLISSAHDNYNYTRNATGFGVDGEVERLVPPPKLHTSCCSGIILQAKKRTS